MASARNRIRNGSKTAKEELEMEVILTSGNFEKEESDSEIPVLVDFYADWCGPCKAMAPVVEELAEEYAGKVKVGKINVDNAMDIATKYRIMSIPTFMVFKGSEAVAKMIGMQDKRVLKEAMDKAL